MYIVSSKHEYDSVGETSNLHWGDMMYMYKGVCAYKSEGVYVVSFFNYSDNNPVYSYSLSFSW